MVFPRSTTGYLSQSTRSQRFLPLPDILALEWGNIPYTSYNKVENNTRDIAIDELERFAGYFGMTIDQVVHFDTQPVDVTIQDKPNFEQINLINQLDEDDRTVVFKIIDTMLTKNKFKDFFNKNVAAL